MVLVLVTVMQKNVYQKNQNTLTYKVNYSILNHFHYSYLLALGMVHGKCDCTHNTKGNNCELCMDLYNDFPWKPAQGEKKNQCKSKICLRLCLLILKLIWQIFFSSAKLIFHYENSLVL